MLLFELQSQSFAGPALEAPTGEGVTVSLAARKHLAFNTYAQIFEILVRSGRIWLTDGPVDHVLSGFQSHETPTRSRVVITALTDAVVTVRPLAVR